MPPGVSPDPSIPGVIYTLDKVARRWRAPGRSSLRADDRAALPALYGTYVPDASTTGHLGTPLQPVYVSQSGVASSNYTPGDHSTYGGRWRITPGSMPTSPIVIDGVQRQMVVLEGLDIHGHIRAETPVAVINCRVRNRSGGTRVAGQWWAGFDAVHRGSAGSYIADTTFQTDEPTELHMSGVNGGSGVKIERVNITGGVDGCRLGDVAGCNANTITASWIHGLEFITGTFAPPEGPHCDALQLSPNIAYSGVQRVEYSYLDARAPGHPTDGSNLGPSCIMVPGATDTAFHLEVESSWLEWGWFPLNSGGTPHTDSTITLTNVAARPGWFIRSGVRYHEVSTSAWNARTTRTGCTDWDTGGAWRRTA